MSTQILHKNRNGCALHGALKVLDAIDGLVPIVHSSAGCTIQEKLTNNLLGGSNGLRYRGWKETPGTNIFEKQVVFGGTARLREQIKNTVKILEAELYVVVTGCAPEIVGDDVPAMVKEAKEQGFPVISVSTPGFKGDVYKGYEWTVKAIIDYVTSIDQPQTVNSKLVNIFGVIPEQDLFWEGNLQQLSDLLASIGLRGNKLFGFDEDLNSWKQISGAALNLVVSPWGLEIARTLEAKFGTPYIYLGFTPVGFTDNEALLTLIIDKLSLLSDNIESVIQQEYKYYNYQMKRLAQTYIRYGFQKEIALVGETSLVLGLARFLQNDFGQYINSIIITDNPSDELKPAIIKSIENTENELADRIYFTSDGKEIDDLLLVSKPEFLLGSDLEQDIALSLSIPLLKITSPNRDQIRLNHSYLGFRGALTFIEDFSAVIFGTNKCEAHKQTTFLSEYKTNRKAVSFE